MFTRSLSMPGVHKRVIHELLRPRQWKPNHEDRRFMLSVRAGIVAKRSAIMRVLKRGVIKAKDRGAVRDQQQPSAP